MDLIEIKQEVFEDGPALVKQEAPEDFEIVLPKQEERDEPLVESQYWVDLQEEVKQEAEDEDQALLEVNAKPTTSNRKLLKPSAAADLSCEICHRPFFLKKSLDDHMRVFHKVRSNGQPLLQLKCHLCEAVFLRRAELNRHLKYHESVASFPNCDVAGCNKTFKLIRMYFKHKMTAHPYTMTDSRGKSNFMPCNRCSEVSTSRKAAAIHRKFHWDFRKYPACHVVGCTATFTSSNEAMTHKLSEHTTLSYGRFCKICNMQFYYKCEIDKHMREAHTKKRTRRLILKCQLCEKTFIRTNALLNHLRYHQDFPSFPHCDVEGCPEKFKLIVDFVRHKSEKHTQKEVLQVTREAIKCDKCDSTLSHAGTMKSHMTFHRNFPTYPLCHFEGCDQKFESKKAIAYHKLKKHPPVQSMQVQCDLCPESFNGNGKKSRLNIHMLTRHVDKAHWEHVCEICLKKLPTESRLKVHTKFVHPSDESGADDSEIRAAVKQKLRDRSTLKHKNKYIGSCESDGESDSGSGQVEFVSFKVEGDVKEEGDEQLLVNIVKRNSQDNSIRMKCELEQHAKPPKIEGKSSSE